MKKIKYLFLLFLLILFPLKVNASNATISVSSSSKNVVVGNTFTVTVKITSSASIGAWQFDLKHDSSYWTVTSGSENLHVADSTKSTSSQKTVTYTYTFKVKKSGTSSITVANYRVADFTTNDYMNVSSNPNSITVKAITQAELKATYSKNNYLSSLSVDNKILSPEFNADTLEYSIDCEPNTTKINITGVVSDKNASVDGLGEKEVTDGLNKFLIRVTSQSGDIRTYTLNVNVKEFDPIIVQVDNKNMTIVRKKGLIEIPNNYVEKIILINNQEITGCESEITKLTLVPLKNEEGTISWYVYNDEKYSLYKEVNFSNMKLYLLALNQTDIPKDYIKKTITIDDISFDIYKLNNNSSYGLLYGMNVLTGEKNKYSFDEKENTVQRYNDEEILHLNKEKNTLILIIIGILVINIISIIIVFIIQNRKKVRKST